VERSLDEAISKVLERSYVQDVSDIDIEELRSRREYARRLESVLSYARRLLQARIDIAKNSSEGDVVTEQLSQTLARSVKGPETATRHVEVELSEELQALADQWIEAVVEPHSNLSNIELLIRLEEAEAGISSKRHQLHEVLNVLSSEVKGRYIRGEASIDTVLGEKPV
jgi:hypothetical protein